MSWNQSTGRDPTMVQVLKNSDELLYHILKKIVPDHNHDDENEAKLNEATAKVSEQMHKIQQLEKYVEAAKPAQDVIAKLKEELATANRLVGSAHMTAIGQRNDITDAQNENKTLKKELERLTTEWNGMTLEVENMRKRTKDAEANMNGENLKYALSIANLNKTIVALNAKIFAYENTDDQSKHANTIATMQDNNDKLKGQYANLQQEEKKVREELKNLQALEQQRFDNFRATFNQDLKKKEQEWQAKTEQLQQQLNEAAVLKPKFGQALGADNTLLYRDLIGQVKTMLQSLTNNDIEDRGEETVEMQYAFDDTSDEFNLNVLKTGIKYLADRFVHVPMDESFKAIERKLSNASSVKSTLDAELTMAREELTFCQTHLNTCRTEKQQLETKMSADIKDLQQRTGAAACVSMLHPALPSTTGTRRRRSCVQGKNHQTERVA